MTSLRGSWRRFWFGLQTVSGIRRRGYFSPSRYAAAVDPARPVALLEHEGALATGRSLLEAFDQLEVLESSAAAVASAREIGTPVPLDDDAIRELDRLAGHG